MKNTLLTTVIGGSLLCACSSHGQGYVIFSNNGQTTSAPVYYETPAEKAGLEVGNTFTAGFRYSIGDSPMVFSAATAPFAGAEGEVSGALFNGGIVEIPGYLSGPVSFVVFAFNGTSFETATINGESELFTLNSISTDMGSPTEFGPGFGSFSVNVVPVPEPSVLGLVGLMTGLLLFRRRR